MDFQPFFKVHTCSLASVHTKSIKLGQVAILNVIFHVLVVSRLLISLLISDVPCTTPKWPNEYIWDSQEKSHNPNCLVFFVTWKLGSGHSGCEPFHQITIPVLDVNYCWLYSQCSLFPLEL